MPEVRGRLLLFLPPIFAVIAMGLSLRFGASDSPILFAQLVGGPTDTAEAFRGRLRVMQEVRGVLGVAPGERVELRATQGASVNSLDLRVDSEGWVEFELPRWPSRPLHLEVLDRSGELLAAGHVGLTTQDWLASARTRGGVQSYGNGSLRALISLDSGVLAVPFVSNLTLRLSDEGRYVAGAKVKVSGRGVRLVGASLVGASAWETNAKGELLLRLRAEQHSAALTIDVETEQKELHIYHPLTVVPGSLSLERKSEQWLVASPLPRDFVWVTLVTKTGRLGGGRVVLSPGPQGRAQGLWVPKGASAPPGSYLVLASSADARSLSTVGVPLDGQGSTFDAADVPLLDGAPAARLRRSQEIEKVRWILGAYVAISGFFTLALFLFRVRRASKRLKNALEGVKAAAGVRDESPQPLVIAVLSLFFAFSLGVLWIVAR